MPVLRRDWTDRVVFTTRIIANLDLPYKWATDATADRLAEFSQSAEDFHASAASFDKLMATGVPGAPRRKKQDPLHRGVFVEGAPTPFLLRKCLLDELAGPVLGNASGRAADRQPQSELEPALSLKTIAHNYALQRGHARLPTAQQGRRLSCGGHDLAAISERRKREALRKERKVDTAKPKNWKKHGKPQGGGTAVALRGPNGAEPAGPDELGALSSADADSARQKALEDVDAMLSTWRGRLAACAENQPAWLDLVAEPGPGGEAEMAAWLEESFPKPSSFERGAV